MQVFRFYVSASVYLPPSSNCLPTVPSSILPFFPPSRLPEFCRRGLHSLRTLDLYNQCAEPLRVRAAHRCSPCKNLKKYLQNLMRKFNSCQALSNESQKKRPNMGQSKWTSERMLEHMSGYTREQMADLMAELASKQFT